MNLNRTSSLDGLPGGADDDSEVMSVLDGYLSAIEAGQPPDPDKLLADHPALAGQLRAYLRVMSVAGRLAEDSSAASSSASTAPAPRSSALSTLDLGRGPRPHVHLLEIPDEREPLLIPRSTEMPAYDGAAVGRYQLQGEIARGGIGAILRGRDADLGRELAIKVLLDSHQGNSEITRRFVEEAQIGGQLQHPGVVPVYELGTFPDRRPYFAMKLVKGRTLAALLAERKDRVAARVSRPRLLRGRRSPLGSRRPPPLSRDLRADLPDDGLCPCSWSDPSRFEAAECDGGFVWRGASDGLGPGQGHAARRYRRRGRGAAGSGIGGDDSTKRLGRQRPRVAGRERAGHAGIHGAEQARGEVERINERADVFGLGAILCEILIGRPPFVGSTREEIRDLAARGDLTDAHRRLAACVVDAELIDLARDCLTAERDGRPRNAGEVLRRVTAYVSGVQERLKVAELAQVEAQTRAEEAQARATIERSRRLRTVGLAASMLVTAGVIGGGWAYMARQHFERAALFNQSLGEAEGLYAEAERIGDDTARWLIARDATRAIERLLTDARNEST